MPYNVTVQRFEGWRRSLKSKILSSSVTIRHAESHEDKKGEEMWGAGGRVGGPVLQFQAEQSGSQEGKLRWQNSKGTLGLSQLDRYRTILNTLEIDLTINRTTCVIWGREHSKYVARRGELGEERRGSPFRREEKEGESRALGLHEKALPPRKAAREKEWKQAQGAAQETCSPKPLTRVERKERVSVPPGLYQQQSTGSELSEASRSAVRGSPGSHREQGLPCLACIW